MYFECDEVLNSVKDIDCCIAQEIELPNIHVVPVSYDTKCEIRKILKELFPKRELFKIVDRFYLIS